MSDSPVQPEQTRQATEERLMAEFQKARTAYETATQQCQKTVRHCEELGRAAQQEKRCLGLSQLAILWLWRLRHRMTRSNRNPFDDVPCDLLLTTTVKSRSAGPHDPPDAVRLQGALLVPRGRL
jgi:hypothetical protein